MRVGNRIASMIPGVDFDRLDVDNPQQMYQALEEHAPDYRAIVSEELEHIYDEVSRDYARLERVWT